MASGKLTVKKVQSLSQRGRYGDGDCLFLLIGPNGSKSWIARVTSNGKQRDIGLGSESLVTLAEAREACRLVRMQIKSGLDPIAERRKSDGIPTFREAAALVFAEQKDAWRNEKHKMQWMNSLETHAFPFIGDVPVNEIDGPAVRDILAAIWLIKNSVATRVRQRINTILDWAVAKGYRKAPLAMGVINKSLPRLPNGTEKHHKALPFVDVPKFMAHLSAKTSIGALALQGVILNATRSGEIRLATWSELDFDNALWTIPAERMGKRSVEHVIPLSDAALGVFEAAKKHRIAGSDFVFQGTKKGKPLSDMTLTKIIRDMGVDATVHGFRSSFKDWAAETTRFPNEVSEAALHHAIANKSEAAYRRGNLLEKRRQLMDVWGDYCIGRVSGNVVNLVAS